MTDSLHRRLAALVSLGVATLLWLPSVHWLFARNPASYSDPAGVPPHARALSERQLQLWTTPALKQQELARMRETNAEWDFMGRSFLVWSLAEMSLREPGDAARNLAVMDEIIGETIRLEHEHGMFVFLMPYARERPFVVQPARSLFLDGEIGLMLALRRVIQDRPDYRAQMTERIEAITARLRGSPLLVAESYPDECWIYDHAIALAATRVADFLDDTDHSALRRDWVAAARQHLVDPKTGLLVSSFTTKGVFGEGPEGSTIWVTVHFLRLVDEAFAHEQYRLARKELGCELGGFAWSREWPVSFRGMVNVDSGAVIPGLDISAGGSGLAFVAASSIGDADYLGKLHATLEFAAFPVREEGRLRYCASNLVGDSALLFADVLGPMWTKVEGGRK